jgi:Putative peptidoglycan binding domain
MVRDRLRARGPPLRRVDPSGCTPRAGWTDHAAPECGNTHHDVLPNFPYDVLQRQLVAGGSGGCAGGYSVRNLQRALNHLGGEHLTVDGALGPATRAAIHRFEAGHGLDHNTVPGRKTRRALGLNC